MPEYIINGIKIHVVREFEPSGQSILEHTISYLFNLMEEQKENNKGKEN